MSPGTPTPRITMSTKHKRRNKFPKPGLQLRLAAGFVGVTVLALMSNAVLTSFLLVRKSSELLVGGDELRMIAGDLVVESLVLSIVLLLPATLLIGIAWTFRTAGPIYRLEQHFRALASGEEVGPCTLRRGDHLTDLCELINEAHETMSRPSAATTDNESRAA